MRRSRTETFGASPPGACCVHRFGVGKNPDVACRPRNGGRAVTRC
jgi:hypothetical protein